MSLAEPPLTDLSSLVRERIDDWRAGTQPDAVRLLAEHPELAADKSLVLDLALEEYCLRSAAGDTLIKSTFCDRFPAYRQSIFKLLEVQEFLDQCPQFAREKQRPDWPQLGQRFLGYDVMRLLGTGALARVYLAREPALGGRLVVIKVSRFGAAEAETLGKLSHPNIVPVHSVQHDSASGWTAICMPLLGTATAVDLLDAAFVNGPPQSGEVIARVAASARPLAEAAIPPAREDAREDARQWRGPYSDAIARLGMQLAEGLHAAHAAGVRHHDIKPSNVLLAWSGRPMLLDFNLSTDDAAATERIGGTLPYMAPELIAGLMAGRDHAALRLDPRCDIYSLGAVLYELLCGQLPARPAGADQLQADAYSPWLASKQAPPRSLRAGNRTIDPRLEAIVLRALAFDPHQRQASAAEFAVELGQYLSLPQRARRYAKQHRREFLAAGAALLATAGGAATYFVTRPPYHQRLLTHGLAQFEVGQFEHALATFDECNEIERDWAEARFARGQTLMQLERWDDARRDFALIKEAHPGWARALMGYCYFQVNDRSGAFLEYRGARAAGVRDIRLLNNYADVLRLRKQYTLAAEIYNEAVRLYPENAAARRGRAHALYCIAYEQQRQRVLPDPQAYEDVRADIRLNPGSDESYYLAAVVMGYAVSVDPTLDELRYEGSEYLRQALLRGMPRDSFLASSTRLTPLMTPELWPLVAQAPLREAGNIHKYYQHFEFPLVAEWTRFLDAVDASQPTASSALARR